MEIHRHASVSSYSRNVTLREGLPLSFAEKFANEARGASLSGEEGLVASGRIPVLVGPGNAGKASLHPPLLP